MSDLKTTIFEQTQLKQTLFERTNKALEDFIAADHQLDTHIGMNGFQGVKNIRDARYQRFCGIWDVVEAAGLGDEYQAWKEAQGQGGSGPVSCEKCEHLHGCRHQCMELPEEMTCGQCVHIYRCSSLFGCNPNSTKCDFYPIRFKFHDSSVIEDAGLDQEYEMWKEG